MDRFGRVGAIFALSFLVASTAAAQAPEDTVNAWRVIGSQYVAQYFHASLGWRVWVWTCGPLECRATRDSTRPSYYSTPTPRSSLLTQAEWDARVREWMQRGRRPGGWRVIEAGRSPMTGDSIFAVALRGTTTRSRRGPPSLIVRCRDRALEIFIGVGAILGSGDLANRETSVRLRFDAEPAESESWGQGADRRGAFSPDASSLLLRLLGVDTLRIEYEPISTVPEVATFRVPGLTPFLPRIAHACADYDIPVPAPANRPRR